MGLRGERGAQGEERERKGKSSDWLYGGGEGMGLLGKGRNGKGKGREGREEKGEKRNGVIGKDIGRGRVGRKGWGRRGKGKGREEHRLVVWGGERMQ